MTYYRHSLFFLSEEEAHSAQDMLSGDVEGMCDVSIEEDRDEELTFELRFFTPSKIGDFDQRWILNQADGYCSYAFNCDDH